MVSQDGSGKYVKAERTADDQSKVEGWMQHGQSFGRRKFVHQY